MDKAMHSEFEGHTPGPWIELDGFIYSEHVEDRPMIAQLFSCSVSDDDHSLQFNECNNIEPNGNLIAAAPALLKENQSLRSELQKLQQWKKEQMQVWGPVLDYMQKHPELSLGESISKRVLEFLKEREKQKELNAELVKGLVTVKSYLDSFKDQWKEGEEYLSFTVESLIKKSKES